MFVRCGRVSRRLSIGFRCRNAQFQSKLDSHVQTALRSGINQPSQIYDRLVNEKIIHNDEFQRSVVQQLDELNYSLRGYHPSVQDKDLKFRRFSCFYKIKFFSIVFDL